MARDRDAEPTPGRPVVYEIRVEGHLGREWTDWFGGMAITPEASGNTLLSGPLADQAALHGLLRRVRDLGIPLVSAVRVEPGRAGASAARRNPREENER